jgi:putative hydrolase of HD superfamily
MYNSGPPIFKFEAPGVAPGLSDIGNSVLGAACLAEQLALENRTNVDHKDGRAETVAEHSNMLAIVGPIIAEQYFPHLDANLVARFATIHDLLEAYVGDTPTYNYHAVDMPAKEQREGLALQQLACDYAESPLFVGVVKQYAEQLVPEARFIRVLDKIMPLLQHFHNGGRNLRTLTTREQLLTAQSVRNEHLREQYPEFEELIRLREELTKHAADTLFEHERDNEAANV